MKDTSIKYAVLLTGKDGSRTFALGPGGVHLSYRHRVAQDYLNELRVQIPELENRAGCKVVKVRVTVETV